MEVEGIDYILCKLCNDGKHYKQLTTNHMHKYHNTTLKDYQAQFQGAPVICQKTLDKRAKAIERKITIICQWCGESFKVMPCKRDQKYCSDKCRNAARCGDNNVSKRPDVRKKISESRKVELVPFECPQCGQIKMVTPYKAKTLKFCSNECKWDAIMRGDNNISKRPEVVAKISKSKMGHDVIQETRDKISTSKKGQNTGNDNPAKRPEVREKISLGRRGKRCGPSNPAYVHGQACDPYSPEFNKAKKQKIRKRDGYTCQMCGEPARGVHHIDYDKHSNEDINLIVLCKSCHSQTNFNREFWTLTFQVLMKFRYEAGYYESPGINQCHKE